MSDDYDGVPPEPDDPDTPEEGEPAPAPVYAGAQDNEEEA